MIKIISLSGGKDSTAMMLYAIDTKQPDDRLVFIFCDTGNEHKLTYEYLDYLDGYLKNRGYQGVKRIKRDFSDKVLRKREHLKDLGRLVPEELQPSYNQFLDLCLWKGRFPSNLVRFCTQEMKIFPVKELIASILEAGYSCENWAGVRAEESTARAKLPERELFLKDENTGAECWTVRPMLHWKEDDCFKYLEEHEVKHNPLYDIGFSRVGCMPCVMANKSDIKAVMDYCPNEMYRIAGWEQQVQKASGNPRAVFFGKDKTVWQKVEWSKTPRTRKVKENA